MWFIISSELGNVCLVEASSAEEALETLKKEYYDQLDKVESRLHSSHLTVKFPKSGTANFSAEAIGTLDEMKRTMGLK